MNSFTYFSFFITCSFLVTTGTITFIEAMRTDIVQMRHILNLETCISIVAAYFYGKFITMLEPMKNDIIENKEIDGKSLKKLENKINDTRYIDWMITTPIMLLVLVLAFQYNSKQKGIKFSDFVLILLLNYGMLGSGYLGEKDQLNKLFANIIGFVFFGLLYGFMYYRYLLKTKNGNNKNNQLLFGAFFILWSMYGIFYLTKESFKNVGYNILDLFSKCFVGIYFWSYSSNIFV
uniref:Bacteriorhodopsin n=1 Tax=Florenciella sp. virus SA2 TaxID=3240092 RepID=A0AB39JEI9_9VIRU